MTFQVLQTYSKKFFYDPNVDNERYRVGNGFGYSWNLDYTADTHGWYAGLDGRTGDYRADTGFTRRTNTNNAVVFNRISSKSKPQAKIIRLNWNQSADYTFDFKGRVQGASVNTHVNLDFQGNASVDLGTGLGYEKIMRKNSERNAIRLETSRVPSLVCRRGQPASLISAVRQKRPSTNSCPWKLPLV